MRFTPAGIAIIEFGISHESRQMEAGISRQVICEIFAIAMGEMAKMTSSLQIGSKVKLTGFFAKKSRVNQQLVLHVNNVVQL